MNTSSKFASQEHKGSDKKDTSQTAFSELLEQPEFKELNEVSSLLRLMDSLDTSARPQYKTYVVGDTAS